MIIAHYSSLSLNKISYSSKVVIILSNHKFQLIKIGTLLNVCDFFVNNDNLFSQIAVHLAFKVVSIVETLNEYVSKMKQNSFTHVQVTSANSNYRLQYQ